MTIKKKIDKKDQEKKSTEDLKINFINSGGNTPGDVGHDAPDIGIYLLEELVRFTLRIPKEMVKEIDSHRKKRIGNVSRNNWILEAIADQMKSE